MYLHLRVNSDGGISATVENQGELKFSSLGSENTQYSNAPFAVFQIHEFDGLEVIETEDLKNELIRRVGADSLGGQFVREASTSQIMAELRNRVRG